MRLLRELLSLSDQAELRECRDAIVQAISSTILHLPV